MTPPKVPRNMDLRAFWKQSLGHSFTKAWIGVLSMSAVMAILVPCARLIATDNNRYQAFLDILEKYWVGWALIVVFVLILLGRIIYAPYLIYKTSQEDFGEVEAKLREQLSTIEKERDAALKRLSDLSGLQGRILHVAYFQDVNDRVGIAVALRITNRGEPTIVDNWGLTFELNGSQFGFGPSHFRDGKFAISDNKGNILTIKPDDMLFNKVGITPIAKGGRSSGFLVFLTKDIAYDRLIAEAPRVTVLFSDAFGHEYKAEVQGHGVSVPLYEPGLDDPFASILLRQAEAIKKMVVAVGEKIKQGAMPARALQLCKADELDSVYELIKVCEELVKNGYPHPLRGIKENIPQEQWLVFLQEAKSRGWDLSNELDTLDSLQSAYVLKTAEPF